MRLSKTKKIVLASSVAVVAISGGSAYALINSTSKIEPIAKTLEREDKVAKVEQPKNNSKSEKPKAEEEVKPVTPPAAEVPAGVTEPVKQSTPVAKSPTVPVNYKWAKEMAAAGISTSDYGYVTDMVLEDYGWRTNTTKDGKVVSGIVINGGVSKSSKMWQNAVTAYMRYKDDLVSCIQFADRWVKQNYGTWAKANSNWTRLGNF